MKWPPDGPVAVLSPHLDDAILSLGAAIHRASREGVRVTVVTVFAGNTASDLAASGWDALAGFTTEGEAVRARRKEDAAACEAVGAEQLLLPFADSPYVVERTEAPLLAAVADAICDADVVLLPGFPLVHRDHRWLSQVVLRRLAPSCSRVVLYAEQPYRYRLRRKYRRPVIVDDLLPLIEVDPTWTGISVEKQDRFAKRCAIEAYRSQLPLLYLNGRKLRRMLAHEGRQQGESMAPVHRTASGPVSEL